MKFLCDRCNTRYSIGDDRVRGKILKIRCKNCANVITVREGMTPDLDATPSSDPARAKKTTAVPLGPLGQTAPIGTLGPSDGGEPPRAAASPAAAPRDARAPAAANRPAARDPVSPTAATAAAATANRGAARDPVAAALAKKKTTEADTAPALGGRGAARGAAGAARGEPAAGGNRALDAASNALNAAFASAMARPAPAALHEEWYVSIDGEQAGPFSLAEAQRWVGQQPFDAELHCWSEGFDDWLPVDKVSHFRGLRKRPGAPTAPSAPPPLPRAAAAPRPPIAAPAAPPPPEDEPKPLFAATMAALERGAPAIPSSGLASSGLAAPAITSPGLGLPPAAAPARATPPRGTPIAPAGTPAAPTPVARPPNGAWPEVKPETKPGAKLDARPSAKIDPKPSARIAAKPAGKPEVRPAAVAPAPMFDDPFDDLDGESGDARTQLEAMPFEDAEPGRPSPIPAAGSALRPSSSDAAMTAPHLPASSTLPGTGANAAATAPPSPLAAAAYAGAEDFDAPPARNDFASDDDLDFGEVSRVVNLSDIGRGPRGGVRPPTSSPAPRPPPEPGLRPSFRAPTSAGQAPAPAPIGEADSQGMAPVARAHRRGLIALLAVAVVMVLGGIGAVVLFVLPGDDGTTSSLGPVQNIDTSRPDDPIGHHPVGSAAPPVTAPPVTAPVTPRPVTPRPRPPSGGLAESPGPALGGDEIEDVARKHQETTQRCYMRSQRGADAILIGDVKKIAVTLTIDREGNVSDLSLSEHGGDNLGRCLSGAIRAWKFRPSSGGTFRFSLNFVSS